VSTAQPTGVRWPIVVLAFLAVLLDGFDAAALAIAVPTLAVHWAVPTVAFTVPLVLTNIGVVVGYLCSGWLAARLGRRRLLIGGVALFAVATLAVAATLGLRSVPTLSVLRLVTGLGLGLVLPVAVSLTTEHNPARRRELVAVIVTLGLTAGSSVGGFFGGGLLRGLGTAGVFWVSGLAPLVLVAVLVAALPRADSPTVRAESPTVRADLPAGSGGSPAAGARGAVPERDDARLGRLFAPGLGGNTALLWTFAFLVFVAAYTMTSWVPTLLTGYGFSPTQAPLGLACLSLGGVLGGVALIPLATSIGIARTLIVMPALGAACMIIAARAPLGRTGLLIALAGAGAGLVASQIGQLTMAVTLYPASARTTGVGWTSALGRAGSIVGPGVAGVLIGLALAGKDIVLIAAAPVLVAGCCAAAIWLRRRSAVTEPAEAAARTSH
jgi:MFS transporter, AAHS family, 4-hydroxybenzoate transporter